MVKKGIPGGLLSGIMFQYPGAFIMAGLGVAAAESLKNPDGARGVGGVRGGQGGGS